MSAGGNGMLTVVLNSGLEFGLWCFDELLVVGEQGTIGMDFGSSGSWLVILVIQCNR